MRRRNFLKGLGLISIAPALIKLPVEAAVPQEILIADVAIKPVIDTFRRHVLKASPWWGRDGILMSPDWQKWLIVNETDTHVEIELIRSPHQKVCPELAEDSPMYYIASALGERSERGHPIGY